MVDISDGGASLRIDGTLERRHAGHRLVHGVELPGRIVEASDGIVRVQFLFDEETHNKVMDSVRPQAGGVRYRPPA